MAHEYVLATSAAGDWEALYVGGRLVAEGHTVTPMDILRACRDRGPVGSCYELVLPDAVVLAHGARFPASLWDLGEAWWQDKHQRAGPSPG